MGAFIVRFNRFQRNDPDPFTSLVFVATRARCRRRRRQCRGLLEFVQRAEEALQAAVEQLVEPGQLHRAALRQSAQPNGVGRRAG